ncbi:MAG: hypothetical protein HY399_04965 [Elusimicrobia bacterium]|nr:hypothetical protein [Elusimicrobiota bacterium]
MRHVKVFVWVGLSAAWVPSVSSLEVRKVDTEKVFIRFSQMVRLTPSASEKSTQIVCDPQVMSRLRYHEKTHPQGIGGFLESSDLQALDVCRWMERLALRIPVNWEALKRKASRSAPGCQNVPLRHLPLGPNPQSSAYACASAQDRYGGEWTVIQGSTRRVFPRFDGYDVRTTRKNSISAVRIIARGKAKQAKLQRLAYKPISLIGERNSHRARRGLKAPTMLDKTTLAGLSSMGGKARATGLGFLWACLCALSYGFYQSKRARRQFARPSEEDKLG